MTYYLLGLSYLGNGRDPEKSKRLASEESQKLERIASDFDGENISNDPVYLKFRFQKEKSLVEFRRSLARSHQKNFNYHHIDPAQKI